MPKTRHVFVDFSNLRIEGRHQAGLRLGKEEAPWHCNFPALLEVALDGRKKGRALLVTSAPFPAAHHATAAGFEVVTYLRSFHNKEKCVDTHLAVEAVREGLSEIRDPLSDEFVFVTGDLDQMPAVAMLRERGYLVKNLFWSFASSALHTHCDSLELLTTHWDRLTWCPPRKWQEHGVLGENREV